MPSSNSRDLWEEPLTYKYHHTIGALRDLDTHPLSLDVYNLDLYLISGRGSARRHHIYKNMQQYLDMDLIHNVPTTYHYGLEDQGALVGTLLWERLVAQNCPDFYKTYSYIDRASGMTIDLGRQTAFDPNTGSFRPLWQINGKLSLKREICYQQKRA